MPVVIVGTLDTKGIEISFARDCLRAEGLDVLVVDGGVLGTPRMSADLPRESVFAESGMNLDQLREDADRGRAVAAASEAVSRVVRRLHEDGRVDGVLALGGSAGTVIATAAMRALPFGVPKVMLSTLASGQTRPYIGGSDIAMFSSVADIAGLNRLTRVVIANAANALAGMVHGRAKLPEHDQTSDRPLITATMFGVTTPCVDRARARMDAAGFEVLVFHATGIGGLSMEGLIRDGQVKGVLDLTTTELADEVAGGIMSAGADRLQAASRAGVPQVVSVGAVDMVNFGLMATVPPAYLNRTLHVHNASVTLMRTSIDENRAIARLLASAIASATGPTALLLPLGGVSALDAPGKPFHDRDANDALFSTLRSELKHARNLIVLEREEHINDPAFGVFAAETLLDLISMQNER